MAKPTTRARKPRPPKTAAQKPAAKPAAGMVVQGEQVRDPRPAADQLPASGGAVATPGGATAPSGGAAPQAVAPPLADFASGTVVVTGPKGGRRRAGLYFAPEPTELDPQDFLPAEGEPAHLAGERIYAILTDPQLTCVVRLDDGTEHPFMPEAMEHLRQAIDAAAEAE